MWNPIIYELHILLFTHFIRQCPFNPTAENIAKHLVEIVAPKQLEGTNTQLIRCKIEETQKCSTTYSL